MNSGRAQGVTIACTTKEFFTETYHYSIIDAPGHRFVRVVHFANRRADGVD